MNCRLFLFILKVRCTCPPSYNSCYPAPHKRLHCCFIYPFYVLFLLLCFTDKPLQPPHSIISHNTLLQTSHRPIIPRPQVTSLSLSLSLSLSPLLLSSTPSSALSPREACRASTHHARFPMLFSPFLRHCDILIKPDAPSYLCMRTSTVASHVHLNGTLCSYAKSHFYLLVSVTLSLKHVSISLFASTLFSRFQDKPLAKSPLLHTHTKSLKRGAQGCQILPTDIEEHLPFERSEILFSEDHFTQIRLRPSFQAHLSLAGGKPILRGILYSYWR